MGASKERWRRIDACTWRRDSTLGLVLVREVRPGAYQVSLVSTATAGGERVRVETNVGAPCASARAAKRLADEQFPGVFSPENSLGN